MHSFKYSLYYDNELRITELYSDLSTSLGLWVLGFAVSEINESQLQTYES